MNIQNSAVPSAPTRHILLLLLALAAFLSFGLRTISTSAPWMHLASGRIIVQAACLKIDPFSLPPYLNAPGSMPTGCTTSACTTCGASARTGW